MKCCKIIADISTEEVLCLPDLLNAGVEELISGLENGDFTSVDLTMVRFQNQCIAHFDLN